MKRILLILTALILSISIIGCQNTGTEGKTEENNEIHVGVSFFPMKDILLLIEDDLKEDGYDLTIEEFSDYQTANNLLKNKELDANMIQHDYFLQLFNDSNDADLVAIQPLYHATFALYSEDLKELEEIPIGSSITMPDDATNFGRGLYLLSQAGLLTFKDNKTIDLTVDDIETNPKELKFDDQVPLTSLAQRYTETGLAIMYPTYAKSLELERDEQRLYVEVEDDVTEGYSISLVSRDDNKDSEKMETLMEYLTSDKVRQFLIDEYSWASSPAF